MKKRNVGLMSFFLVCAVLIAVLSGGLVFRACGNEIPFTGAALEYYESLTDAGFPKSYAIPLTNLHLLHPEWNFVPIGIGDGWQTVIEKETKNPSVNVIHKSYPEYRHPSNDTLYDSGYYQASVGAVCYFMDPRNFLNEEDIFQFYDFSGSGHGEKQALDTIFAGTFMEASVLENGSCYAEYLVEVGEEIGIDPVYLAVKLRQEQGERGTSPIISGTCGSLLWQFYRDQTQTTDAGKPISPPADGHDEAELRSYDGYYNPFNISATGNGIFSIYLNAMKYAVKGTPEMADEWGGSPSWNTRWKALWGGAYFIQNKYISVGQSSVYLQKFNVASTDPKALYSHQYMTNVAGALSEGRTLYRSFVETEAIDSPCTFRIPVYSGMPEQPSADPANGNCKNLAPSVKRFSYQVSLTEPFTKDSDEEEITRALAFHNGDTLTVQGTLTHSYGDVRSLEYRWDNDGWTALSDSGEMDLSLPIHFSDYGEHILIIRGESAYDAASDDRKDNRYVLAVVFSVTVIPPPTVHLSFHVGNTVTDRAYYEGSEVTLPVWESATFVGWAASNGCLLPSGGSLLIENDVTCTAVFLDRFLLLDGAALSTGTDPKLRFYAAVPESLWNALAALPDGSVTVSANLYRNGMTLPSCKAEERTVSAADGTLWHRFSIDSPAIAGDDYRSLFQADFSIRVSYSDGTQKTFYASGQPFARTASDVARAALNDPAGAFSEAEKARLRAIA